MTAGKAPDDAICGAKSRSTGKACMLPKGWGTDHLGYGACKHHLGNAPALRKSAAKEAARAIVTQYGGEIDGLTPEQALLDEVARCAGIVAWLQAKVTGASSDDDLTELTSAGTQPSVWVRLYHQERQNLVHVSKVAITLNIAERQVRLAEQQGELLAAVIQGVLGDLGLTPKQQQIAPQIVRRHLLGVAAYDAVEVQEVGAG